MVEFDQIIPIKEAEEYTIKIAEIDFFISTTEKYIATFSKVAVKYKK